MELSYTDATAVLTFLQRTTNTVIPKTVVKDLREVIEEHTPETVVIPTAGKKTSMPGFGRSQTQIDTFTENEQERFDKRTEEDLLKEQRAEEREVRKAEKQEIADEKKAEAIRSEAEIADIKAVNLTSTSMPTAMPKSPWKKPNDA